GRGLPPHLRCNRLGGASRRRCSRYLITMYFSNRATSALYTYLPISRRNCSIEVYGRYSLNSRSMRGPIPGIARISASVAVLMLIGTILVVSAVLLLPDAGVVGAAGAGAGVAVSALGAAVGA